MTRIPILPGPPGPPGPGTQINAAGDTAGRAAYDAESMGFTYADTSVSPVVISIKQSGASGDWSPWFPFQGPPGEQGAPGADGADGADGTQGPPGADGVDAYEDAVAQGFVGTREEWLLSLVGETGPEGADAYEVAVAEGFVGTRTEWLASLGGIPGPEGPIGPAGPQGPAGADGEDGLSFQPNASGPIAGRSEWDGQPQGFSFYATDEDVYYFKLSNTSADWSPARPRVVPGPAGPEGPEGPRGAAGPGVAAGGAVGQVLTKTGAADYQTGWANVPAQQKTVLDYGAVGAAVSTTGTIEAGSSSLLCADASTWKVGMGVLVKNAGPAATTETAVLDVTGGATASGNLRLILNGTARDVAVVSGDSAGAVANKIRTAAGMGGYTLSGSGTTVTITATGVNPRKDASFDANGTGVAATVSTTVQGRAAQDLVAKVTAKAANTLTLDTPAQRAATAQTVYHDDLPAIQAALDAERIVRLPPIEGGYAANLLRQVNVPNGRVIDGNGWGSRLVVLGSYPADESRRLFQNLGAEAGQAANPNAGSENVEYRWVAVEGGGHATVDAPEFAGTTLFKYQSAGDTPSRNRGARVRNCTVKEWPGVVIHALDLENFEIKDNHFIHPQRGSCTLVMATNHGTISGNNFVDSHDDCVAINADGAENPKGNHPAPRDIAITGNTLSINVPAVNRGGVGTGQPVALRGAWDVTVTGNVLRGGQFANVYIEDAGSAATGWYYPSGITIDGNRMKDSSGNGVWIDSAGASGIEIGGGNQITRPDENGVYVLARAGGNLEDITVGPLQVQNAGQVVATGDGISVSVPAGTALRGLKVLGAILTRSKRSGVFINGSGGTLEDVTVQGVSARNSNTGGTANVDGIALVGASKFVVSACSATDSRGSGSKACRYGVRVTGSTNGRVSECVALGSDHLTAGVNVPAQTNVTSAGHTT